MLATMRTEGPVDFDAIGAGDRVTIRTPQGQERTGRAVMYGPAGWVLNMGGPHGTPGIASPSNVVRVKKARVPGPRIPGGLRTEGPGGTERGRVIPGSSGSFMTPPGHPDQRFVVETDLRRRPENRSHMSLSSAVEADWLDAGSRARARMKLSEYEKNKPPLSHPAVQEWVRSAQGYFGEGRADDESGRGWPSGTEYIRRYYPDYEPIPEDTAPGGYGQKASSIWHADVETETELANKIRNSDLVTMTDSDVTIHRVKGEALYRNAAATVRQGDREKIAYSAEQAAGWARDPAELDFDKGASRNWRTGQDYFNGEPRDTRPGDTIAYTADSSGLRTEGPGMFPRSDADWADARELTRQAGARDGRLGKPRASTSADYRAGYNAGFEERLENDPSSAPEWKADRIEQLRQRRLAATPGSQEHAELGGRLAALRRGLEVRTEGPGARARDDEAMERVERRMLAADAALRDAQREGERVGAAFDEKYPSGTGVSATDQAALDRVDKRLLDAQLASDAARREQQRVLGLYRERYGDVRTEGPGAAVAGLTDRELAKNERTWDEAPGSASRTSMLSALAQERARRAGPWAGRDLSTGDLPPVKQLKHLSDGQIRQLVDRIIPQRRRAGDPVRQGEPWPESDPAFTDYPRHIAGEGNKRNERRYRQGLPGSGGVRSEGFGYDPELPAGFQDADFEMRELEDRAREVAAQERAAAVSRPGVGDRAWILPEQEGNDRLRGLVRSINDGQYEIDLVSSGRTLTVPEARVLRPIRSEGVATSVAPAVPDLSALSDADLTERARANKVETDRVYDIKPTDATRRDWLTRLNDLARDSNAIRNEDIRRSLAGVDAPQTYLDELAKLGGEGRSGLSGQRGAVASVPVRRNADGTYSVYEVDRQSSAKTYDQFTGSAEDVARYIQRDVAAQAEWQTASARSER